MEAHERSDWAPTMVSASQAVMHRPGFVGIRFDSEHRGSCHRLQMVWDMLSTGTSINRRAFSRGLVV